MSFIGIPPFIAHKSPSISMNRDPIGNPILRSIRSHVTLRMEWLCETHSQVRSVSNVVMLNTHYINKVVGCGARWAGYLHFMGPSIVSFGKIPSELTVYAENGLSLIRWGRDLNTYTKVRPPLSISSFVIFVSRCLTLKCRHIVAAMLQSYSRMWRMHFFFETKNLRTRNQKWRPHVLHFRT